MQTITLTPEQTACYDACTWTWKNVERSAVYERAYALADKTSQTVEIHTSDGIVIDAVRPEGIR